jgi:hypothetical protein
VKFPPLGQRGLDGAGLDNAFYVAGTTGYPAAANAETFLMVQIETPEAVAAVDRIAAIPGIDGLFIGPGDLSLRLDCPLDWNNPKMIAAEDAVAAAAARHGVAWGRPSGTAEDIAALARKGGHALCTRERRHRFGAGQGRHRLAGTAGQRRHCLASGRDGSARDRRPARACWLSVRRSGGILGCALTRVTLTDEGRLLVTSRQLVLFINNIICVINIIFFS